MKMFSATDSSGMISGSWWTMRMPASCASRGRGEADRPAVDGDAALVGRVLALEDAQQRRLAGAVLADQRRHRRRPAGPGSRP